MTLDMNMPLWIVATLALGMAACRTAATDQDRAARIVEPDDRSRKALQGALEAALHTKVTLAADALTETSVLIIERSPPRNMRTPPAQGRITESPIQFRLVIHGEDCVLIDQRDRSRHKLENTRCEPE
ncbi:MAG: hypothetical protein WBM75_05425 [Polyangiales bacterium]|jgi:hypothetical protein